MGNIILWSVVECGLGIIAGSLPMLRKLFRSLRQESAASRQRTAAAKAAAAVAAAQRERRRQYPWLNGCCHAPRPPSPHRPVSLGRVQGLHNPLYDAEVETVVIGGRRCHRRRNANDDEDGDKVACGGPLDYSSSSNAAASADDVASTHHMIRVTREWEQTESPAVVGNAKE